MIRGYATALVMMCIASPAIAGMTPEEMRARIQEIDAELRQIDRVQGIHTLESVRDDVRDLDRRSFDSELELARVNARREVVLVRAREEADRQKVEREVLQRKLDSVRSQRAAVQSELSKTAPKVDAGVLPPQEITAIKLQLIKLDEQTATIEFELSGGGSHFSAILANIEIELAGINAVRKALDQRREFLTQVLDQATKAQDAIDELMDERRMLERELVERTPPRQ